MFILASNSPFLALHLVGLALAIGCVLILDLRLLSLMTGRTVTAGDTTLLRSLRIPVHIGLTLLWVSGIAFLIRYSVLEESMLYNPKLHAKIIIVVLLTLTGIAVERFAVPIVLRQEGKPLFAGMKVTSQLALILVASASAISWYVPFLLGSVKELNSAPNVAIILALYAFAVLASFALIAAARLTLYAPERGGRYATQKVSGWARDRLAQQPLNLAEQR
jgi:hypothetical protein